MLCAYPDVLRADLQRFYGLNLDDLGYGLRARRAADLAANLPPEARIWGKLNSACSWSTGDYLHRTGGVRTVGELYQLLGYKK